LPLSPPTTPKAVKHDICAHAEKSPQAEKPFGLFLDFFEQEFNASQVSDGNRSYHNQVRRQSTPMLSRYAPMRRHLKAVQKKISNL
jgi:hypothetical protein